MSIKVLDKSGSTPQEVLLAGVSPVDAILNNSSTNAIQNKAVYNALKEKVEKTVTDLVNYYDKSQVYNKTETRAMVDAISTMTIEVVTALPTTDISTTTIYFLRQGSTNVYDQYVYVNGAWVKIGDTTVDLSQYLTIANFNIAIADYYTKSEIDTLLANVDIDVDSALDSVSENPVQNKVLKTEFDKKADKVTSATNGDVATLDANGNLLDGGKALSALPTTFVGTTADWNALSAADKAKYQLVSLTDDAEMDNRSYSTNELPTGQVWIDGKAIYKKTVKISSPSNGTVFDTNSTIDLIVSWESFFKNAGGTQMPMPYVSSSGKVGSFTFSNSTKKITFMTNDGWTNHDVYLTYYFTKTT